MEEQRGQFPARVIRRFTPIEQLMKAVGERASLEEGQEPFFFPAEISSNRLDAYYTHMDPATTLRNFAADAQAGVSFLDSHDSYKLGMGYTLTGTYEEQGDVSRVVSDIYTVPGIRFGGVHSFESTDDFIRAVKAAIVRDVSVGFYGGSTICDICGEPVWGWTECPHFPGVEYPVGEQGRETVLATAAIIDAHLAEASAVYDGATPEAMILKVDRMLTAGEMDGRVLSVLQRQYRINLPGQRNWPGVNTKSKGRQPMSDENVFDKALKLLEERGIEGASVEGGIKQLGNQLDDTSKRLKELESDVAKLTEEVARLQPLADDGKKYREDLISETLAEGVRALGDKFPKETYRGILEKSNLDGIKKIRAIFEEQVKARLKGKRQSSDEDETTDDTETPETQRDPDAVPDEAYMV